MPGQSVTTKQATRDTESPWLTTVRKGYQYIPCPDCNKKGVRLARLGGSQSPQKYLCKYCDAYWHSPLEDTWLEKGR